jgi:effector-binding domain-containing protein
MKKIVLITLAVVVILTAGIYILIPSTLTINNQISISASDAVASKFLTYQNNWKKWWPGAMLNNNEYEYQGIHFTVIKTTNSAAFVTIQKGNIKFNSQVNYLADDFAVRVSWVGDKQNSLNPVERIMQQMAASTIGNKTTEILKHFKSYLENVKNAYGYKIYIGKINNPILLASTSISKTYPNLQTAYTIVDGLRKQSNTKGASQLDYPMLNITQIAEKQYQLSVAIPIDKKVAPDQNSSINYMVKGGNLLIADVKGGPNTINNALNAVKDYMKDHKLISPAMYYQSMITDRSVEKDTSKWVTKIQYPIF